MGVWWPALWWCPQVQSIFFTRQAQISAYRCQCRQNTASAAAAAATTKGKAAGANEAPVAAESPGEKEEDSDGEDEDGSLKPVNKGTLTFVLAPQFPF